jgi:hypothetical protein
MSRGLLITTFVALALTASAAGTALGVSSAGGRPPFARAYVGTATGTLRAPGRVGTWTVRGLTFRLQNARYARGRWGGTYLVTSARVTFDTTTKGQCTSTKSGSFSIGRLSWESGSIAFVQNLRSPAYAYQARVSKEHPVTVTQECAGAPGIDDLVSPAGGLWLLTDIDEPLVPGKRLTGRRTQTSDRGTRTWTWNLAPR